MILVIATVALFAGSVILFGWTSGAGGVILSPILAVFGWYFWFPIFGFVSGLWWLFNPKIRSLTYRLAFVAASCLLGLAVSFFLSGKGASSPPDLVEALRVACVVSGALVACMVVVVKPMVVSHVP
jgi:hypothetical protein